MHWLMQRLQALRADLPLPELVGVLRADLLERELEALRGERLRRRLRLGKHGRLGRRSRVGELRAEGSRPGVNCHAC